VASDADGNFVVVWGGSGDYDGLYSEIWGRRFDSQGNPLGTEFMISQDLFRFKGNASVSSDPNGDFVVTWDNDYYDRYGAFGVFGRRYDGSGAPQGFEFQINSYTPGNQRLASVATTGTDQFVVVWQSGSNQDGNLGGIFGQRFDFSDEPTIHVGDLDRKAKNVGATWRAQVKTLVHDDNHLAESGVLVVFNVSGGVGTRTCTTVASGVCEVSVVVPDSVPSLTFTVRSLSKAGFSYDAGANHDPDPDSDGTTILVNQP
jgi:hypothetical protein